MEKIHNLNELRLYVTKKVVEYGKLVADTYWMGFAGKQQALYAEGVKNIQKEPDGWRKVRPAIIGNKEFGIMLIDKRNIDKTEEPIMSVKRDELLEGYSSDRWDKIYTKCSLWLERNGFYPKQTRYKA